MISYDPKNDMMAAVPLLPPPPEPKPVTGKAPAPAAAVPADAPLQTPPAVTSPYQPPVPSKEQIGVSSKPPPDYSSLMESLRGALPSTQNIVDGWKTPEAQNAAKQFQNAILANFYLASTDANSLNMFFQSNPYSYLLGQSVDNISKIMDAKKRKESGDDPLIGELVKAFVALKAGVTPSDALRLELIGFARKRLGSAVAPKEIEFKPDLPKNKAGKIMRLAA